jgi:hypothetical protein
LGSSANAIFSTFRFILLGKDKKLYYIATFGDALIALTGFWTVAFFAKSRYWFHQPKWRQLSIFILVSLVITIVFEKLATGVLNKWEYVDIMPTLPVLGTALTPILQWIILPLIIVWFVKRQVF